MVLCFGYLPQAFIWLKYILYEYEVGSNETYINHGACLFMNEDCLLGGRESGLLDIEIQGCVIGLALCHFHTEIVDILFPIMI